ncbi:glycosyltransferase family 2 protein [Alkalicoccobacillus murimartini]|uniref:Glycosyltransferase involved in cell wall biosynthesis n=1 Tax=Alkalicoccobacillus murimartini TaxID=171685 RepID=A0ABT9YH20_9BACI|nr:glycosyltransferase family 2 protein [Alkalicoccobacillus murimartini]MDQ0206994.1 glycosyltransferase involved in cell wall biosynthesis [Alkalicoccobacillus murimartini]
MNPYISVIIPTYNRSALLIRAVKSVLEQTYEKLEIIVVDDGSTDDTKKKIKELDNEKIVYIEQSSNTNGSVARNLGIKRSKGDYVAFLDSDDVWLSTKLHVYVKHIEENRDKNVFYSALFDDDGYNKKIKPHRAIKENEKVGDYIFSSNGVMQTSTLMLSSKLAKKIMFDENLGKHQDWDFCLRLEENKNSFYFINEPLVIRHREQDRLRISNYKNASFSTKWVESSKKRLSKKAYNAFYLKTIASQEGEIWSKTKVLKLLIKSILLRSVPFKQQLYFSRFLFPKLIQNRIESLRGL